MANLQTSKKDVRSSKRKKTYNDRLRNRMKNTVKKFRELVEEGKIKEANEIFDKVQKVIDKAAKGGVIKDNTASRKKSRLSRLINKE